MKASEAIPAIPSVGETATAAGGSNESTQEAVSSNLSHGALQAARGPQSSTGDQSASPDRLHWRSWVDAELDNLPASAQAAEVSDNAASQSSPHQLVNTQRHSTQPHGNAALLDSDPMAQELGHDVRDRPDDAQVGHQQCQSPSLAEEGERLAESSTLAQQVVKLIQEACHTVMVAAERQEQHSLVLSVLESMKQVRNGLPLLCCAAHSVHPCCQAHMWPEQMLTGIGQVRTDRQGEHS